MVMRSYACKITSLKYFSGLLKSAKQKFLVFRYFVCHMTYFIVTDLIFLNAIAIARNLGSNDFNVSRLSPQL